MTTPVVKPKKRVKTWIVALLISGALIVSLVVVAFLWFGGMVRDLSTLLSPGSPQESMRRASTFVTIQPASPYRLLQAGEFMGAKIARFESTARPQEFLLITGLDKATLLDLWKSANDKASVEKLGNLFLRLKHQQQPQTLKVDTLSVLPPQPLQNTAGPDIQAGAATMRKIELTYHLSGENKPRSFDGGVLEQPASGQKETLLVSYSPAGKFDEHLIRNFFRAVRIK